MFDIKSIYIFKGYVNLTHNNNNNNEQVIDTYSQEGIFSDSFFMVSSQVENICKKKLKYRITRYQLKNRIIRKKYYYKKECILS